MTEDFCTVTDDDETSCQNNCEQPDSGSSDGNVRKRVLGYYEAWVHDRKCNGMVSQPPREYYHYFDRPISNFKGSPSIKSPWEL